LKDISLVFDRMDTVFRKMVRGSLKDDVAIAMVKDDVYNKMCVHCANKSECVYLSSEICDDALSDIVKTAFTKGKVSVLDIPQRVGSICNVAHLTMVVNSVLQDFKGYYELMKNMDSSKLLIASQLNGVSKLLDKLSIEVSSNISFNKAKQNHILEELSYHNLLVHECLVYEEDINTLVVHLIVNAGFSNKKLLEKVVSSCCNGRLHIVSSDSSEGSKTTLLTLKTKPHFDLVYGSAAVNKGGKNVSGDNYTVIKIDDSRYMVALCDGMGSGKKASSVSSLTISLIENYYKAGFDDEVIMSSINKLLMLTESDTYSTVDICVFDLKKNNYSFIKLGSSVSFIKGSIDTCEIEGSGLPIGILEDIKPHIIFKKINQFDTVILCSDGVVDSFSKTSLKSYINSLDIINPNSLARAILNKAIDNYGGLYRDDMTVVAVRVFPN
ncbi:MAG: SpoIIE family protein phosphatase, partial [Clostridia bacterium]|nr:SpoIIE family protein phosphatase [Clostridia bacterium]